jgi:hypothetical protein
MVAPVPAQISKLPRRKLSSPSSRLTPNSCRLILLQTLLHSQSRQPLWNQVNPNSLYKCAFCILEGSAGTPGVVYRDPRFHTHCSLPTTRHPLSAALYFHDLTNPFSSAIDKDLLYLQELTNPFFHNSRVFTSIQNPGGVGVPGCSRVTGHESQVTSQNPAGWPSARRWPSKKRRQAIRASAAVLAVALNGRFASIDPGASSLQRRTPSHPQGFWLASR